MPNTLQKPFIAKEQNSLKWKHILKFSLYSWVVDPTKRVPDIATSGYLVQNSKWLLGQLVTGIHGV
jgi:hypothetical protein